MARGAGTHWTLKRPSANKMNGMKKINVKKEIEQKISEQNEFFQNQIHNIMKLSIKQGEDIKQEKENIRKEENILNVENILKEKNILKEENNHLIKAVMKEVSTEEGNKIATELFEILSKTERLLEEGNSLWYWSNLGYNIINPGYTINGDFNKSNIFTTDLVLESKINEKLTVAVSNYYRRFDNSYLVEQFYNINSENGNITSSPIEIFTNQGGNILGVNLSLISNIKPSITQYFQYDYQNEFYSDDLFNNTMKSFPTQILDYHFNYSPIL